MNCPACHHPTDHHGRIGGCLVTVTGTQACPCERTRASFIAPTPTPAQARQDTDAAVAQAATPEDSQAFIAAAEQAVQALAATADAFTTDDVWEHLRAAGVPAPREPRALGPVMRRALRDKVIHAHGWTASKRRHQAPVRIYSGRAL